MSEERIGPSVTVKRSCMGCKYERSQSYRVQGDSGHDIFCDHPEAGGKTVGDTNWSTPDWCPAAPPPPSLHREPMEADREAAGNAWYKTWGKSHMEDRIMAIFEGRADDSPLVQAFMRHRLAFSTPAASEGEAVRRELMDRARNMMGMLADLREAVDLDDESASEVLGYCDDLETAVHNIGAVASHIALPLPKAGEGEASPYAPRPNCHTIATFDALLDWMRSVSAGEWTWLRNSVCKYVTIKLDTRAGAYRIEDRNDNSLSLDDLVYQFNSTATPSTEGRKGEGQADG